MTRIGKKGIAEYIEKARKGVVMLTFLAFCISYGLLVGCIAFVIQAVFGDSAAIAFVFTAGIVYGVFVFGH